MEGSQPVHLAVFAKVTNRPLPERYLPRTNESTDTTIHRRQEGRLVVTAVMTPESMSYRGGYISDFSILFQKSNSYEGGTSNLGGVK
jgi:hypothetical protein